MSDYTGPIYRYYTLHCDACETALGMTTDASYPTRGLTICSTCWTSPETLPRHLKSTLIWEQVHDARVGGAG